MRANPTGGQVVSGAASITTVPGTVTISQATSTASINWHDFSIASGELTRFQVPTSTSATLNRVTGSNLSAIYGTLQSNGQLYLINPNGIVIGATGRIDTAGFLATTLNFSDTQFNQQGDLNLSGSSRAGVSNQGTIHASTGDVYLIAAQVNNSGTISAPKGTVGLAAGNQVLLQKAGDQHLFVQVDGTSGKTQPTGVTNSGSIRAATAELKAAGGNAYALAINNTGNIAATGIATINGQVYLTSDGGDISNSGTISAKQANGNGGTIVVNAHSVNASTKGTAINSGTMTATGATGGTVELLGDTVGVSGHGAIDVSGNTGGGTALIGGDEHGANAAVPDAEQTDIGPGATIQADALTLGAGGKVVVWSNDNTEVDGLISVRGGAGGGDGGFVETSGAQLSVLTAPDIAAPEGHGGMWLLDPSDITISDTGTPTVTQATLITELESGSVTLDASQGSGGTGTITWTQTAGDPMNVVNANGNELLLNAPLSLTITGVTVHATGNGGLNLSLNQSGSTGTVAITGSTLNLNGGSVDANGASFSFGGTASTFDFFVNSPNITLTGATVTTTDTNYENGTSGGLGLDYYIPNNFSAGFMAGTVSISNSVINCAGAQIGNPTNSFVQGTQVSISDSTINDDRGTNPQGSAVLLISGYANTAGSPGVSISDGSSITTDSGEIEIQGTGLVAASSDATGVEIAGSSVTCGTAGAPGSGTLEIQGYSDPSFTSLTPNSVFANNAYGVQVSDSTISSYSTNGLKVHGHAYAANNLDSIGVELTGGSVIESFNGEAAVKGKVQPEEFLESTGEANVVAGVEVTDAQIEATGASARVYLDGDGGSATATDNGLTGVHVVNSGVYLLDSAAISASGANALLDSPLVIDGRSGPAQASSGNAAETDSVGVWVSGGTTGDDAATVINSGLGATVLAGVGGAATGPDPASVGVALGNYSQPEDLVSSTGGGSIGIAGLGGSVGPGASSTFSGLVAGVVVEYSKVQTTTGDIAIMAAAGTSSGAADSSDVAGLFLRGGTLQTDTSTAGANQIPNGGSVPPLILIYATDSTYVLPVSGSNTSGTFEFGSATNYAVQEDATSSVVTGNLVMGNFYDLFSTYGAAATVAAAPTFAQFNTYITGTAASTISSQGIKFNPAGIIDLSSTLNQVTNLDSALDGTGGFNLYDSVSLTVDPIGGNDNLNYGQVDVAGQGPVSITVAPNMNLTLTDVSPLTGMTSAAPVISTTGSGNTITLTTSGTGQLINTAGPSALATAGGSNYILYAASPSNVTLDGIAATQTLYNTASPGAYGSSANTIAYASMAPIAGTYILDGTAYTDSGMTVSTGTTIDLVFNGTVLGSTTTDGTTGAFSFTIGGSSGVGQGSDLNSGVLLIDMADNGNTYFQANSPPATITGVDIWGSTLRVMSNTASNFALGQVAGNPAVAGVNYAVTGSNLSTNGGVNLLILPNSGYTLNGNLVAGGTLITGANSALSSSGTGTVTLTGTSIALGGSLISAGTVKFATAVSGTLTPTGAITDTGSLQVGGFILENGSWSQVVGQGGLTALPAFSASNNFEIQGSSTFLRAAGIDSANGDAYEIADVYGLQGLASPSGDLLGANAELVANIDATGTPNWNGGAGFVPIGTDENGYAGTFNGQGYTINGLYINQPNMQEVGLFGAIGGGDGGGGTVENLGVTNVQITGGADIESEGGPDVGGVAGENFGTISKVYVTGTVNAGSDSNDAGGLVAYNAGTIRQSYSTVAVNGSYYIGGLVGYNGNTGSIRDSFSIGPVSSSGGEDIGGLVGDNEGLIANTYSAGMVTAAGESSYVGGLVGYFDADGGTISNSFWDTDTAGSQIVSGVGSDETPNTTPGVTAATTAELESQAYVEANAMTEPTFDFTNVWTTYSDTLTPQLIGLPIAGQVPSSPASPIVLTVDPSKDVNDALFSIVPFFVLEPILNPNIIGGAGGVAGDADFGSNQDLENRLAAKYGRARAEELLAIIEEDRKDGSTVNTGTLATKWAANTGLSKLLRIGEATELSQGLTQSQFNNALILNLFHLQDSSSLRNELSQAAAGKGDHGH